jgi:hypothetical protein
MVVANRHDHAGGRPEEVLRRLPTMTGADHRLPAAKPGRLGHTDLRQLGALGIA